MDSAIFNQLIMKPELLNAMKLINPDSDKISEADIQNELTIINRRFNFGTEGKTLDYLSKDKVILVNKKSLKIPRYLNTFGIKSKGNFQVVVSIKDFVNRKDEIMPRTLFALLQNGMLTYELTTRWGAFTSNMELMKNSCISYSRLVTKIFDKLFALDLNKYNSDFISFIFAKFFLVNMCDKDPSDTVNHLAMKACFNRTSENTILNMEKELEVNYSSIFQIFEQLKEVEGLNSINIRSFVENYVRMFGENAILSLDYLPAFYHIIASSVVGGGIVKDTMIDNVAGKFNSKIFSSIVKIL
jgi:hypothetical protein